jgi:hypothetical protein
VVTLDNEELAHTSGLRKEDDRLCYSTGNNKTHTTETEDVLNESLNSNLHGTWEASHRNVHRQLKVSTVQRVFIY